MPATMCLDQTQHLAESLEPHNTDVLYEIDLLQFEAHASNDVFPHREKRELQTEAKH